MESKNIQDVLLQGFEAKDTAFINWETITKKGNTALKEAERKNLYERVREAYNNGYDFVVIVDEEHLNKTVKAEAIIDFIDPKYIVRVSATTKTNKEAEYIEIDEEVKRQAEQILETNHLTMEQAIQSFFQWMVQSPDEARKELMRWKEEKNRDEN